MPLLLWINFNSQNLLCNFNIENGGSFEYGQLVCCVISLGNQANVIGLLLQGKLFKLISFSFS